MKWTTATSIQRNISPLKGMISVITTAITYLFRYVQYVRNSFTHLFIQGSTESIDLFVTNTLFTPNQPHMFTPTPTAVWSAGDQTALLEQLGVQGPSVVAMREWPLLKGTSVVASTAQPRYIVIEPRACQSFWPHFQLHKEFIAGWLHWVIQCYSMCCATWK